MKQLKTLYKDDIFICQISSSVLGSIESLLVLAKREDGKYLEEEKQRQFLADVKAVEHWCFDGKFRRAPSMGWQLLEMSVILSVAVLAFIGFLAIM